MAEVVRSYEVFPAVEQTKLLIIERLKILFDAINILFQNKMMGRKGDEIISMVKSTAISLYLLLKPKIIEYINRKHSEKSKDSFVQELNDMIEKIESLISSPSELKIEDALYISDVLNIFCHEYGITKITYFAGTTKVGDDVYEL
jgi:hypothetical protein